MNTASDEKFVYFDRVSGYELVKIGFSRDPARRLQQHQRPGVDGIAPDVSRVLELRVECQAAERKLHRHFSHLSTHSPEVFTANEELVGYLRWLWVQPFTIHPTDSDEERKLIPCVPDAIWLPGETRWLPKTNGFLVAANPWGLRTDDARILGAFYTPSEFIRRAREALGAIDLDPASDIFANKTVAATRIFTMDVDGTKQPWAGRVWLNPPFAAWEVWVPKMLRELRTGNVEALCLLCATRTLTTQAFHPALAKCEALFISFGRYRWGGTNASKSPDDGCAIMYYGQHRDRFEAAFEDIGTVFFRSKDES